MMVELKRQAVADGIRMRLLLLIQASERTDWTVKDLADALSLPANGLYYHLRVLEDANLVAVTGSVPVGRMAERTYGPVAPEELVADWSLARPEELLPYFDTLLDLAKADVQSALFQAARHFEDTGEEAWWRASVQKRTLRATPQDVREFNDRLMALLAEFQERSVGLAEAPEVVRLNVTCAVGQTAPQ